MDMPKDVQKAAVAIALSGEGEYITFADIARAILAERKRCADVARKEAEGYRDHNLPQAAMGAFQTAKTIEAP